jgi:poly(A) polymerase
MLRGVKYSQIAGVALPRPMAALISKHRLALGSCSAARLTEEVYKILASGSAAPILVSAFRLRLLEGLLPAFDRYLSSLGRKPAETRLAEGLAALDRRVRAEGAEQVSRGLMLAYLFRDMAEGWRARLPADEPQAYMVEMIRQAALPLQPSRKEMEQAARRYLRPRRRKA